MLVSVVTAINAFKIKERDNEYFFNIDFCLENSPNKLDEAELLILKMKTVILLNTNVRANIGVERASASLTTGSDQWMVIYR